MFALYANEESPPFHIMKITLLKSIAQHVSLGLVKGAVMEAQTRGNTATVKLAGSPKITLVSGDWRRSEPVEYYWEIEDKVELEDIGRTLGLELDRRQSVSDLHDAIAEEIQGRIIIDVDLAHPHKEGHVYRASRSARDLRDQLAERSPEQLEAGLFADDYRVSDLAANIPDFATRKYLGI